MLESLSVEKQLSDSQILHERGQIWANLAGRMSHSVWLRLRNFTLTVEQKPCWSSLIMTSAKVKMFWTLASKLKLKRDLMVLIEPVWLWILGKSDQDAATHHALLGEQADPQAERQDLRAVPTFCGRWEDRRWQSVPRHGHGSARQESRGPVPGVPSQVWPQNLPQHCSPDGKFLFDIQIWCSF